MRHSRALVFAAVVAVLCAGVAPTQAASPTLGAALDRALRTPGVARDRTAAIAVDLQSGRTVFAQNADTSLLPASVEKLAISFTALHVLGPRFCFHTEVVGVGTRTGRTWSGNLLLVGFGDPTLTRADLNRLARRVAATGIRRIEGRVLGDDTYFDRRRDALGWKPSYLGIESPPLSALSVGGLPFAGANGSAEAAARAFTEALQTRGIAVDGRPGAGRARGDAFPIAFDLPRQLEYIGPRITADSDNFIAEMVMKEIG